MCKRNLPQHIAYLHKEVPFIMYLPCIIFRVWLFSFHNQFVVLIFSVVFLCLSLCFNFGDTVFVSTFFFVSLMHYLLTDLGQLFWLFVLDNSLNKVLDNFVSKFQNSHKAQPSDIAVQCLWALVVAYKNIAKSEWYGLKLVKIVTNFD